MALPSLDAGWRGGLRVNPRVYVLEVRGLNQPDGAPVAWLMIEREEVFRHDECDGSIHEASIRLSYERIDRRTGIEFREEDAFLAATFAGSAVNRLLRSHRGRLTKALFLWIRTN